MIAIATSETNLTDLVLDTFHHWIYQCIWEEGVLLTPLWAEEKGLWNLLLDGTSGRSSFWKEKILDLQESVKSYGSKNRI
jgi:hypothetical protein